MSTIIEYGYIYEKNKKSIDNNFRKCKNMGTL